MSEEVSAAEPIPAPHNPAPPGFFAHYRLAIIGASVFFLVIIFLLVGVAVGMAKKNFEKKFYLTQIEKLKGALTDSLDKRTELDQELKELRIELKAKKDHIRELEDKVAQFKHETSKADRNTEASAKVADSNGATTVSNDPGEAYLRLKAGDCLIDGSDKTTANWQECLKKGKKTTP